MTDAPRVLWHGLAGAGTALHLARAAERLAPPLLVIARDAAEVARLEDELRFFAPPALPILAFPDYETLPYDQFSPHPDIISQRLRTLSRLPGLGTGHRGHRPADLAAAPAAAQLRRRPRAHARRRRRRSTSSRSGCA